MRELISAEELADVLGICYPNVWRLCRRGKIPFFKVGRFYRFDLSEVLLALHSPVEGDVDGEVTQDSN